MPVQGIITGTPAWAEQVQRETADRGRPADDSSADVCLLEPADEVVEVLFPGDVQLLDSERQRMESALAELRLAQTRKYYDAPKDAADRTTYYGNLGEHVEDLQAAPLYDRLNDLISRTHTHKLDYEPSTELYPWVDLHPDGKLHSIYSGKFMDPAEAIESDTRNLAFRNAAMAAASAGGGLVSLAAIAQAFPFNCEHVVPQSWFDKKGPMRGDLHHLFACDPQCNSMRGSFPFAEHPGEPGTTCGKLSSSKNSFEPAGGKGAAARATLYFLLRYPGLIGDEPGEYTAKDLKTLLDWHKNNPVTDYERHRNAEIFRRQGNRNPLIDHPEWADRIDFAKGLGRLKGE